MTDRNRRKGMIELEVVMGVVLLGIILLVAADAILSASRMQDGYTVRQAALQAASAQLQRHRAGAPLDSLPPDGLIPDCIALDTTAEPGTGAWAGFDRVRVRAIVTLPSGGIVREEVTGYVRREAAP